MKPVRGFTLIEVLVALFIVALGIGALLSTLTAAASNVDHLRAKSFAEWVALNRISTVRLTRPLPAAGSANGEEEFAGAKWYWRQEVTDTAIQGLRRIEVSVSRTAAEDAPALALAVGFIPLSMGDPSGFVPNWSVDVAAGTVPGGGTQQAEVGEKKR